MRFETAVITLALFCFAGGASAKEYSICELPLSRFVDTEVSTNIPFNVVRNDTESFTVDMEAAGPVSNNVQIAFGCDRDCDGRLSPEESGLVLGWRCGKAFLEDVADGRRLFVDSDGSADRRRLLMRVSVDDLARIRAASLSDEAGTSLAGVDLPPCLFSSEWNLMRVTLRGVEISSEYCQVSSSYHRFAVFIR